MEHCPNDRGAQGGQGVGRQQDGGDDTQYSEMAIRGVYETEQGRDSEFVG
jgi:hypothetical protein